MGTALFVWDVRWLKSCGRCCIGTRCVCWHWCVCNQIVRGARFGSVLNWRGRRRFRLGQRGSAIQLVRVMDSSLTRVLELDGNLGIGRDWPDILSSAVGVCLWNTKRTCNERRTGVWFLECSARWWVTAVNVCDEGGGRCARVG